MKGKSTRKFTFTQFKLTHKIKSWKYKKIVEASIINREWING